MDNEKDILLQVAQGDEQAFTLLFNAYHQQLALHIFHLTDSVQLAEEIVQDVFLKIWMSRDALADVRNFQAYLFVVSKNHALNALRGIARERRRHRDWELANQPSLPDTGPQGYYFSLIDEAVRQLPPQQQKAYLLSREHRLSYKDIGREMDISPETVKKYLRLAIASISAHIRANIEIIVFLAAFNSLIQ